MGDDGRVNTLVSADYRPDSTLIRARELALDKTCAQVALRGLVPG